jgi:hypothetical protein
MIVTTTPEQTRAILGAMRRVGTIGGTVALTAVDRVTIDAAWRHVFRGASGLDVEALPMTTRSTRRHFSPSWPSSTAPSTPGRSRWSWRMPPRWESTPTICAT